MDDQNASCAHNGEEDAQLSLLDLPVEVCTEKERNVDSRVPRAKFIFVLIAAVISSVSSRLSME